MIEFYFQNCKIINEEAQITIVAVARVMHSLPELWEEENDSSDKARGFGFWEGNEGDKSSLRICSKPHEIRYSYMWLHWPATLPANT